MRKTVCLLLAFIMLLAAVPAPAEGTGEPEHWFTVGHTTQMKGDFFTEMFGNNTADIDVRALLHGYNLVHWDENQGVYLIDPSVVKNSEIHLDNSGNKVYTLTLQDDLLYSDGSPITAWDYAFSLLLMMAPEIEEIGGKIYRSEHLAGSSDYLTGKSACLSGVGVTDDHTLVITLDKAFLPYFFETGLLLCVPYPIGEIAPGCRVYANGAAREAGKDGWEQDVYGMGIYIGNADPSAAGPVWSAALLARTILDPDTGYNSHPRVTSGPYTLRSFDGVTAVFDRNPYFKGALKIYRIDGVEPNGISVTDGHTVLRADAFSLVQPTITPIVFTKAENDTMIRDLQEGRLDLINKALYGPALEEGLAAAGIVADDYPRVGLSFLTFSYEKPTVGDMAVRQAIAWCMDRDALTKDYCGRFGFRVDGYFGIENWEYLLATHKMDAAYNFNDDLHHPLAKDENWKALSLNLTAYRVDTDRANALLDEAGWTLNREGKPYDPKRDDVRCKQTEAGLTALELSMIYPAGNRIVDTLEENFTDNLARCGILLTVTPVEMPQLLAEYYRETPRQADLIYLATNFHAILDPAITYSADETPDHLVWNNTYSDDEELYRLAVDMRKTEQGDVYGYVKRWIAFQERYNQVLPTLPVYSNIYYDFHNARLTNYRVTAHVTWSQAILEAEWQEAAE